MRSFKDCPDLGIMMIIGTRGKMGSGIMSTMTSSRRVSGIKRSPRRRVTPNLTSRRSLNPRHNLHQSLQHYLLNLRLHFNQVQNNRNLLINHNKLNNRSNNKLNSLNSNRQDSEVCLVGLAECWEVSLSSSNKDNKVHPNQAINKNNLNLNSKNNKSNKGLKCRDNQGNKDLKC